MRGAPLSPPRMLASRPKSLPQCAGAGAVRRQPVPHPPGRLADDLGARAADPDLLIEPAVEGLLGALPASHPPLRELPTAPAGAAPKKDLVGAHQHDGHIGAKTIRIDEVAHGGGESLPHRSVPP